MVSIDTIFFGEDLWLGLIHTIEQSGGAIYRGEKNCFDLVLVPRSLLVLFIFPRPSRPVYGTDSALPSASSAKRNTYGFSRLLRLKP
jgi:hypothetical protein